MLEPWSLRWVVAVWGNKKMGNDVHRNAEVRCWLVILWQLFRPQVRRSRQVLEKASILRAIRNGKSQANKKPTQHGCVGSI